jgi:hypothetical protein
VFRKNDARADFRADAFTHAQVWLSVGTTDRDGRGSVTEPVCSVVTVNTVVRVARLGDLDSDTFRVDVTNAEGVAKAERVSDVALDKVTTAVSDGRSVPVISTVPVSVSSSVRVTESDFDAGRERETVTERYSVSVNVGELTTDRVAEGTSVFEGVFDAVSASVTVRVLECCWVAENVGLIVSSTVPSIVMLGVMVSSVMGVFEKLSWIVTVCCRDRLMVTS